MWKHKDLANARLKHLITTGQIALGGNMRLKIYGSLSCSSGKRMKRENRIFFSDVNEALQLGYRACLKCMK